MTAPLHVGDTTTVTGVVRTVTALHPPGHLRITVDVAPNPTAPLTTRDALAEALHDLGDPCLGGCRSRADALLASGALTDATKLAALADKWNSTPDYAPTDYDRGRVDQRHAMTAELLAALSAQSERAE